MPVRNIQPGGMLVDSRAGKSVNAGKVFAAGTPWSAWNNVEQREQ